MIKTLAESCVEFVTLTFAAFTFMYGALISVQGTDKVTKDLKKLLRKMFYGTGVAVVLGACLSVLALLAVSFESSALGIAAIVFASAIISIISYVTIVLALDVWKAFRQRTS